MAANNRSANRFYTKYQDETKNKVFINPNFSRSSVTDSNIPSSTAMYVNPKFSHLLSNVQHNKTKIYVNPNFMKNKNTTNIMLSESTKDTQKTVVNNANSMCSHTPAQIEVINIHNTSAVTLANSRYSFVRQNARRPLQEPIVDKTKTTFQVNKYKSISLHDVKKKINDPRNTINNPLSSLQTNSVGFINKNVCPSVPTSSCSDSRFKLVNCNKSVIKNDKIIHRTSTETRKKMILNQSKVKKNKGSLKKNNIPCPMFKKFGKCLRKMKGNCEFLHDKKHVSVCRKFIKGLCHDKDCLLSHDLTTKKMPTCYFYLQGTCTKSDCPYLHVKLNDKVKICPDFIKGYCEKGSKCLLRHISENNKKCSKVLAARIPDSAKRINSTIKVHKLHNIQDKNPQFAADAAKTETNIEYRYYQEDREQKSDSETSNYIKPIRCKLGTLPSFIQL